MLVTSKLLIMGTERFTIGNFTIPIVKSSFLKRIFISWGKKEHFTIGKKFIFLYWAISSVQSFFLIHYCNAGFDFL